jgi:hypothetical protein
MRKFEIVFNDGREKVIIEGESTHNNEFDASLRCCLITFYNPKFQCKFEDVLYIKEIIDVKKSS